MVVSDVLGVVGSKQVLCTLTSDVFVKKGRLKVPLLKGTVLPCTHWELQSGILYAVCPSSLGVLLIAASGVEYSLDKVVTNMLTYERLELPMEWGEKKI